MLPLVLIAVAVAVVLAVAVAASAVSFESSVFASTARISRVSPEGVSWFGDAPCVQNVQQCEVYSIYIAYMFMTVK
jgi:hypothetical protein